MGGSVLQVSAAEVENNERQTYQSETQYNFEEEITTFFDLGIMSQALETFMAENPESTEVEQEAFLIQFVENGELRAARNARGIWDNMPSLRTCPGTSWIPPSPVMSGWDKASRPPLRDTLSSLP